MKRPTSILFVIDTDQYSGNFEREMCGYVTGRWDNETHGGDEAGIARGELSSDAKVYFDEHVVDGLNDTDDVPHFAPQIIVLTPGYWNNGMGKHTKGRPPKGKGHPAYQSVGIFFDKVPPQRIIDIMKERAKKFCEEFWPNAVWKGTDHKKGGRLKCEGFRIVKEYTEQKAERV